MSPEQIGKIANRDQSLTEVGNSTLRALTNLERTRGWQKQAGERLDFDRDVAAANVDKARLKHLVDSYKLHQKNMEIASTNEQRQAQREHWKALEGNMTGPEKLAFDRQVERDKLAQKTKDNAHRQARLELDRDTEKRKSDPNFAKSETNAERQRREESAVKHVQWAQDPDVPFSEQQIHAEYFNDNAANSMTKLFIPGRTDNVLMPNKDTVELADLPVIRGRQVTVGDIRSMAEQNGVSTEVAYRAAVAEATKASAGQ